MEPIKVFVYRNLHKKCWSVRDVKTRKVIFHLDSLLLSEASFKVSLKGRERVLLERQKNLHAGVQDFLIDFPDDKWLDCKERVRYNPYVAPYFFDATERKIERADFVFLNHKGEVYFQ